MSAEPKRVELTEEETSALWAWWSADFPAPSVLCETVAAIVAAREAAAEQAGREDNALHEMCYVSGSKALEAREAAVHREALLEAEEESERWKREASLAHVERTQEERAHDQTKSTLAGLRKVQAETVERYQKAKAAIARVEALALPDGIWKGDKHVRLTRRDRTLGCDITESYVRVDDLTAALAEPERDEEGGR